MTEMTIVTPGDKVLTYEEQCPEDMTMTYPLTSRKLVF